MFAKNAKTEKKSKADAPKLITVFEMMKAEFPEDIVRRKKHFSEGVWFNGFILGVIILDTVVFGLAVDANAEDDLGFIFLKMMFFMAFVCELVARTRLVGWEYFASPWNFFDYVLVVANSADVVYSALGHESVLMRVVGACRLWRLLRLIKRLQGLRLFYPLWMVIETMLNSAISLIWTLSILVVLIYIIAVTMTTLLYSGEQPDALKENWQDVHTYFRGVGRSFFTVTQVITNDSWDANIIQKVLDIKKPLGAATLFLAIIICNFGMFNVIVGTMVKEAINLVKRNKEQTTAILEQVDRDLIEAIANELTTHSHRSTKSKKKTGGIDKEEYMALVRRSPDFSYKMRLLGICPDDADDLFEILDADKSGEITGQSFIYGVMKVRKEEVMGSDLLTLITFCQQQCFYAECIAKRLEELNFQADTTLAKLVNVGKHFTQELRERNWAKDRHKILWKNADAWSKLVNSFGEVEFTDIAQD